MPSSRASAMSHAFSDRCGYAISNQRDERLHHTVVERERFLRGRLGARP